MKRVSKEATLREVLAEVSLVDLASMLKSGFLMLGCYGLFFIGILFFGQIATNGSENGSWLGIPDWGFYLFTAWIFISGYTADSSYHEHRFNVYFPRAGYVWSIPIAAYLVFGFSALPEYDAASGPSERLLNFFWWIAFWIPIALTFGVLETGHRKLIEKRERELEEPDRH